MDSMFRRVRSRIRRLGCLLLRVAESSHGLAAAVAGVGRALSHSNDLARPVDLPSFDRDVVCGVGRMGVVNGARRIVRSLEPYHFHRRSRCGALLVHATGNGPDDQSIATLHARFSSQHAIQLAYLRRGIWPDGSWILDDSSTEA